MTVTVKKPAKKRNRTQKNVSLALTSLVVVVVLVVVGKSLDWAGSLTSPVSRDSSRVKFQAWDGKSNINLVVKSDLIYSLSFDPQASQVTILTIPDDTYLQLPFDFGSWPARSIYGLGQAEKPPMGARLLKETVSGALGLPLDGYILLDKKRPLDKMIEEVRNRLKIFSLLRASQTDLSPLEFTRLFWGLAEVRADKVKVIDLGASWVTKSILLPDGSRALGADEIRIDALVQKYLTDKKLADESLNIGIYNATSHPRLAEKAGRMITNMGGRVVFTSNSQNPQAKTMVVGASSYTKNRLSQIFAPQCLKPSFPANLLRGGGCDITDPEVAASRAQINLVLGEDFFERSNRR